MARKPRQIDYIAILKKMGNGGIKAPKKPPEQNNGELLSIEDRLKKILNIVNTPKKDGKMLFFVMYDIENNKVRRYIVKYLEKKGCSRIQKSIFLGNLDTQIVNQIKQDLAEVQSAYDNYDSILVVPITAEYLRSMKIIGQNINLDIIMQTKNALFF